MEQPLMSSWCLTTLGVRRHIQGSSTVPVKRPTSPWMPFPLVFAAIEKHISAANRKCLDCDYDEFKSTGVD
ncbi:hypothetical protein EJ110_NYTH57135 [Nymphaea thermarum]|nr:hypothetical protein EJ110_NYTH57135 [Nymphaea thermarum]